MWKHKLREKDKYKCQIYGQNFSFSTKTKKNKNKKKSNLLFISHWFQMRTAS